jgi:hypothetical protein
MSNSIEYSHFAPINDFMAENYKREWDRKTSLEQRAITVLTASGAFVTIVFAFGAAISKHHNFDNFTTPEKVLLAISLGFFIACGILCLVVNRPISLSQLPIDFFSPNEEVVKMPEKVDDPDYFEALRIVLEKEVKTFSSTNTDPRTDPKVLSVSLATLEHLRVGNDDKASVLRWAIAAQLVAILILGFTAIVVIA